MSLVFIIIIVLYSALILALTIGFYRIKPFKFNATKPATGFSIIVPFKNEAENLPALLKSVLNLNYPVELFEVVLVNDNSDDESVEVINRVLKNAPLAGTAHISVLKPQRPSASPKKEAIKTAIKHAKHTWVITTDADCTVPENWLKTFDAFIQTHEANFIAAPVIYSKTNTFFQRFQALDFYSLMGATIGGFGIQQPFLCNGANLAYKTAFFDSVKGFDGNDTIASGDDIFLLEKAVKFSPDTVHYLKAVEATVSTKPQPNFKALLNQRLRWAAKASKYNNRLSQITGLIVLLTNLAIICGGLLVLNSVLNAQTYLMLFAIKLLLDFIILYKTAAFLNKKNTLWAYALSSLTYPFFSVFVAFLAPFVGYKWKGRYYRQ